MTFFLPTTLISPDDVLTRRQEDGLAQAACLPSCSSSPGASGAFAEPGAVPCPCPSSHARKKVSKAFAVFQLRTGQQHTAKQMLVLSQQQRLHVQTKTFRTKSGLEAKAWLSN